MELVNTILGDVPESDVRYVEATMDDGASIHVTREWFYIGSDEALKKQASEASTPWVRRDVWVTFKRGHSAQGIKGL